MLKSLDLFTGYGGITLALEPWCQPIAYVEIEEYAQRIIAERMADGSLPRAPILADVKNIEGQLGICDIITGGFPCQDLSVAGSGKGLEGERSGLFYEIARLTKEIQPSFVFLENVPAIRTRGLYNVAEEFSTMGYDCRWTNISASYVGAPHIRSRWFFLAYAKRGKSRKQCRRISGQSWESAPDYMDSSWWLSEPNVGRVDDGTSTELDVSLSKERLNEKVRILRCCYCSSEMGQWKIRGQNALPEAKILQQKLLQSCPTCREQVLSKVSKKTRTKTVSDNFSVEVRSMWDFSGSPNQKSCGWKYLQQSPIQHSYLLHTLPRENGHETWNMGPKQQACSRVSRIKALGNGVVPAQARLAFEYLLGIRSKQNGN